MRRLFDIEKDQRQLKPILMRPELVEASLSGNKSQTRRIAKPKGLAKDETLLFKSPYGIAGDLLWIREKWRKQGDSCEFFANYPYDFPSREMMDWKPSIHLKRDNSRILCEIINIKLERLDQISEEDAIREGTKSRKEFIKLWDKINKERNNGMYACGS